MYYHLKKIKLPNPDTKGNSQYSPLISALPLQFLYYSKYPRKNFFIVNKINYFVEIPSDNPTLLRLISS